MAVSEQRNNAWFRSRLHQFTTFINQLAETETRSGKRWDKNTPRKILRYGTVPEELREKLYTAISKGQKDFSNDPLIFSELTRYNTFFEMHPEKVCGKEVVTTSHEFPLTIKGTKEDIINAIRKTLDKKQEKKDLTKEENMRRIKLRARALKLKLELELQKGSKHKNDHLNGWEGFEGLDGLGELGKITQESIDNNLVVVDKLLQEDKKYTNTDTLDFDEVVRLYNPGISEEEIKAWVWYQKGQGEKMKGWEKYFLKLEQDIQTVTYAKSASELGGRQVTIKDNHFRDLVSVDGGTPIGKLTNKKHEYDKEYYVIIKTGEVTEGGIPANSLVYVKEKEFDIKQFDANINDKTLTEYVKAGYLFYNNGRLLPYPIYGFANMYDRELELQRDKNIIIEKYGHKVYYRQYNYVVQPIDKGGMRPRLISVQNPDPGNRPKILAISKFAKEFQVSSLKEETGIDFVYTTNLTGAFVIWLNKLDKINFKNVSAFEIEYYYIQGHNLSKKLSEEEKSNIEKYGMLEAEELFTRFLYEAVTFEDQQKIDFKWNRLYNGHSAIPYHKVPVGFSCSAMFKSGILRFTQAQREAIAFMEIAKSGIIAYDVGVGKTMSAIITLANNLYSGKCKRPLIVVPNPTYQKWVREIIGYTDEKTKEFVPGVLSNVGYKVNEWYNLGTAITSKADLNSKIEEKTITVLTYEGLAKIGFSSKIFDELFDELTKILNQEDVASLTPREIEKRNQKFREMLGQGIKGTVADIDTLGIDYMVIDEAHNFKNVFENVLAGEDGVKRFKITGAQSTRAVKAFFLCNYIQRYYGRNVMLLTATPFTNSPLEIYSMLSLVAYNYMKKNGLNNVQDFMESFVLQTLEYVNSYDDSIKEAHVVKSFNNRLVLQQLIFNHIAYKTGEDAGVKRPCKINLPRLYEKGPDGFVAKLERDKQLLTYLEMNQMQKDNQAEIVARAKSASPGDGDLMRALAQSLDNAVSPFLYKYNVPPADYKEFVDESTKLKYVVECIRSVKKWHEERNEPVSGQVIYINRGKDFFPMIKEYLEKEVGFRKDVKFNKGKIDEVEIITSGMSLERKEDIKEAFLAGNCKVIIGTATIREGIDLQRNGTVLYNCYPDWNPTDVKQLEGRIWRQGNLFGYVRIVMPLVQDSMDVFVFQKLEEKTARINDLWYKGGSANVIDLDSMNPEEVKFALFTNLDAITKIMLDKEKKELQRKYSLVNNNLDTLKRFDFKLRQFFHYREQCKERLKDIVPRMAKYYLSEDSTFNKSDWWKMKGKEGQKSFIERVQKALDEAYAFLNSAHQEDKELLRNGRILNSILNDSQNYDRREDVFGAFKSYLSEVRKAEETILKQKGYTINDDMNEIIKSFEKDLEEIKQEAETLMSPEYYAKLFEEVRLKKEKLAVRGESAEVRAKEFAAMNYILSYKQGDVNSDSCFIPEAEKPVTMNNKSNKDRLRLRAKALSLKLKLMKAA